MGFSNNGMTSLKNNTSLRKGLSFFGNKNEISLGEKTDEIKGKSDLSVQRKREVIYRKNVRLAGEIIFYLAGIGLFFYYFSKLF